MELIWFAAGVLVLAWLALAVVCVRKGRVGWIAVAIFLPVPVAIVTGIVAVLVAGAIVRPQQTGGLDDFSRAYAAIYLAAGIAIGMAILSSYLVLAVGAIRPSTRTASTEKTETTAAPAKTAQPVRYNTRWRLASPRRAALAVGSLVVVAVAVVGVFALVDDGNQRIESRGDGSRVVSSIDHRVYDQRVDIVAAQARAYSVGDVDTWLSYYTPDASMWNGAYTAESQDARDNALAFAAVNDQWTITGPCERYSIDQVSCPMNRRDAFHGPVGIVVEGLFIFTFNEEDRITAFRIDAGTEVVFGAYAAFDTAFDRWLEDARPDVHAKFGPRLFASMPNAEDISTALLYVQEFIAQSDLYSIDGDTPQTN